jgi:uncharacterized protein
MHLHIFVKNPIMGKVKTRIAKNSSESTALNIYIKLMIRTHEVTKLLNNINKRVHYDSFIPVSDIFEDNIFQKNIQLKAGLGDKMKQALNDNVGMNVIIGSDCPELDSITISDAFEQLNNFDYVIGPAHDGGFYLLGTNIPITNEFENIEWSTNSVCEILIHNLKKSGKTYYLLQTLHDVDTLEDWEQCRLKNKV